MIMEWIESAGESYQQRQAAFWLLRLLSDEQLRFLRKSTSDSASVDAAQAHLHRIREAEQQLHEMMPLSLWLEGLLYDLANTQRSHSI